MITGRSAPLNSSAARSIASPAAPLALTAGRPALPAGSSAASVNT